MCREGNRHRGIGHRACTLGLARRGECLFATDTEQGRGDSGLPRHRPWRLPAPGAESAQAAAAIGVPLTHTRCTGPCTAGLAVPGHSGHRHCPHGSCWWDLQHHLLEHSGCSKMLSWLRVQMQVPLVRSGQHSGQCWGQCWRCWPCPRGRAGSGPGAAQCVLGLLRGAAQRAQRSACAGSVQAPYPLQRSCLLSGTCVGSARAGWAAMPRQCAGRVGSVRAGWAVPWQGTKSRMCRQQPSPCAGTGSEWAVPG